MQLIDQRTVLNGSVYEEYSFHTDPRTGDVMIEAGSPGDVADTWVMIIPAELRMWLSRLIHPGDAVVLRPSLTVIRGDLGGTGARV